MNLKAKKKFTGPTIKNELKRRIKFIIDTIIKHDAIKGDEFVVHILKEMTKLYPKDVQEDPQHFLIYGKRIYAYLKRDRRVNIEFIESMNNANESYTYTSIGLDKLLAIFHNEYPNINPSIIFDRYCFEKM